MLPRIANPASLVQEAPNSLTQPFQATSSPPPRVFDVVLFNGELDMLKFRYKVRKMQCNTGCYFACTSPILSFV